MQIEKKSTIVKSIFEIPEIQNLKKKLILEIFLKVSKKINSA
jgi:hypothetical protein